MAPNIESIKQMKENVNKFSLELTNFVSWWLTLISFNQCTIYMLNHFKMFFSTHEITLFIENFEEKIFHLKKWRMMKCQFLSRTKNPFIEVLRSRMWLNFNWKRLFYCLLNCLKLRWQKISLSSTRFLAIYHHLQAKAFKSSDHLQKFKCH